MLAVLGSGFAVWARTKPSAEAGRFILHMRDYAYQPAHMTWRVGETVTLTLEDDSQSKPPKHHEFMVGRDVNTENGPFGPTVTDGYKTPFFDGVTIEVLDGHDINMVMAGGATLAGKPWMPMMSKAAMKNMGSTKMEQEGGFMPVLENHGTLTISFKVPDKPGQWSYGCFQQSGQHYLNGMRGAITVTKG